MYNEDPSNSHPPFLFITPDWHSEDHFGRELVINDLHVGQDTAYWASWALSHFASLAASGVLCALISLYPFDKSSFSVVCPPDLYLLLWNLYLSCLYHAYLACIKCHNVSPLLCWAPCCFAPAEHDHLISTPLRSACIEACGADLVKLASHAKIHKSLNLDVTRRRRGFQFGT